MIKIRGLEVGRGGHSPGTAVSVPMRLCGTVLTVQELSALHKELVGLYGKGERLPGEG